jgi:hypothetical protein
VREERRRGRNRCGGIGRRPFSGRRHASEERDGGGGPVSARPCEGGGGPGHGVRSSWGPRTRARAVGWRQPGDGDARSRAGEAEEEREGRESEGGWPVGRPVEWVPPVSEGKREGERMAGGPRVAVKCFQIGSKVFKLDSTQN